MKRHAALGCALALSASFAHAMHGDITPDERLTGTYSSLCYHEESGGDILGFEVSFVSRSDENTVTVLYQQGAGALLEPELLTAIRPKPGSPFRVDGAEGEFLIELLPGDMKQIGLTLMAGAEVTWRETLSRRKPQWQGSPRLPFCR